MASQSSFESHVMCPVCLDIYKNPMSLKCRHSMCKQCIDQLVKRNGDVVCPQCRTVSRSNDIAKDFQLKSLVDTVKSEIPAPKYPCSICQTKAFGFYCQQCKILVCNQCKANHKNIPTCRDHSFSFDTYHKDNPLSTRFNVEGVEKSGIGSDEAMSHFTAYMADMEKFAFLEIDKAENHAVEQIKQYHTQLKEKVSAECVKQKNQYISQRNSLQRSATYLKTKVEQVMNTLKVPDSKITTAQVVKELDAGDVVKKQVDKLKETYSIDRKHSAVAPVVKEGQYMPSNAAGLTQFTTVNFTPFKLIRNGVLIRNATQEWSNISTHTNYEPGDRLLTPSRNRHDLSPSLSPPQRRRYSRSRSPQYRRSRSPYYRRSRSPVNAPNDPRPGPSQSGQNQNDQPRFRARAPRSRSPWSRSRSRTPNSRSRSRSLTSSEHSYSYYRYSEDGDPGFLSYDYSESSSSYDGAGIDNYSDY